MGSPLDARRTSLNGQQLSRRPSAASAHRVSVPSVTDAMTAGRTAIPTKRPESVNPTQEPADSPRAAGVGQLVATGLAGLQRPVAAAPVRPKAVEAYERLRAMAPPGINGLRLGARAGLLTGFILLCTGNIGPAFAMFWVMPLVGLACKAFAGWRLKKRVHDIPDPQEKAELLDAMQQLAGVRFTHDERVNFPELRNVENMASALDFSWKYDLVEVAAAPLTELYVLGRRLLNTFKGVPSHNLPGHDDWAAV